MSNAGSIIKRLQTELAALQQTNNRLLAANREAVTHLQNCDEMVRALTAENQASRRIIWAMIRSQDGEVSIPDDDMRAASDDKNQLSSCYDNENCITVIKAFRNEGESTPPDGTKADG